MLTIKSASDLRFNAVQHFILVAPRHFYISVTHRDSLLTITDLRAPESSGKLIITLRDDATVGSVGLGEYNGGGEDLWDKVLAKLEGCIGCDLVFLPDLLGWGKRWFSGVHVQGVRGANGSFV
jgi:hypothetical protein